jgi:hypothetical protein
MMVLTQSKRAAGSGGRTEYAMSRVDIHCSALDCRGAETAMHAIGLSDAEWRATAAAARGACGMVFTGIDVRRRPNGAFVVLACNSSPMFAAIERRTGAAPVTEALADLLTRPRLSTPACSRAA